MADIAESDLKRLDSSPPEKSIFAGCPKCEAKTGHAYEKTVHIQVPPREYSDGTLFTERLVDHYKSHCGHVSLGVREGRYFISTEDQQDSSRR